MKHFHNLTKIQGADMETRFTVDGKRVSRETFEDIERMARMFGRIDCFHTRAIPKPCGKTRRWNYSTARW